MDNKELHFTYCPISYQINATRRNATDKILSVNRMHYEKLRTFLINFKIKQNNIIHHF